MEDWTEKEVYPPVSLIISSVLKYATTEELCSPLKSSICKPNLNRKELVILSLDDQKRLESHIENELSGTNVGIMISLYTGLQIGDICALNWSDINIDAKTIFVRHTISSLPFLISRTRLIVFCCFCNSLWHILPHLRLQR